MNSRATKDDLHMRTIPTVFALSLLLAGCSVFNRESPSAAHFMLAPARESVLHTAPKGSIIVRRVTVQRPFDVRGFVYRMVNGQWRVDSYNGFLADPGDMIGDALVRALEDSGCFTRAETAAVSVPTDFAAETVVESFYADFSDPAKPVAVVRMRTYVVDRRKGGSPVYCVSTGEGSAPITPGSPESVADAMSAAVAQAIHATIVGIPMSAAAAADSR
jgi:ABC-type uncharacterized transport system auxiliary subunit